MIFPRSTTSPPTWAGASPCEDAFRRESFAQLPHDCPNCIPDRLTWRSSIYLSVRIAKSGILLRQAVSLSQPPTLIFYELAAALGPPPKVTWLRRWTHPT